MVKSICISRLEMLKVATQNGGGKVKQIESAFEIVIKTAGDILMKFRFFFFFLI